MISRQSVDDRNAVYGKDRFIGFVSAELSHRVASESESVLGIDFAAQQNDARRRVSPQLQRNGNRVGQDIQVAMFFQRYCSQQGCGSGIDHDDLAIMNMFRQCITD